MSDALASAAALAIPVTAQFVAQVAPLPDGQSAAVWWLVGLAAAAAGANQVVSFWRNISRDSAHRSVAMESVPQSKEACEKLHDLLNDELRRIREAIVNGQTLHTREAEQRSSGLHKRIDPIAADVARVEGRLNDHLSDHRANAGAAAAPGRLPHG